MKKKILIPYATYGSGHKAIAAYIEKYFKDQSDEYEIKTIDILQYTIPLFSKLTKVVSEYMMLKQPLLWDLCFKLSDTKITAKITEKIGTRLFKNNRLKKDIEDFNPDLTISTHFFGSSLISYYNKKSIINSKLITIVTDYVAHELWLTNHQNSDYLVVCSKEEKRFLVKNKNINKNKIKTYGIPIFPKSSSSINKDDVLKKLRLNKDNLTCVFFAGGGNGSTATLPYIKRLLKTKLPINLIFISGKNEKLKNKIKEYVSEYNVKNCKVYGYVNNVPELLQLSDFVVTKPGGAQTTECLYFKKPMLMIRCSGGQESGNVRYIVRKEYGKNFNFPWTLTNYITKIVENPKCLNKIKNSLNKMNNQDAMEKIYELSVKLLNK